MFCKKCGSKLPEGAKFCKNCGTPTGIEDEEKEPEQARGHIDGSDGGSSEPVNDDGNKKDDKPQQSVLKKIIKAFFRLVVAVLIIFVVIIGTAVALDYFDVVDFKPAIENIDTFRKQNGLKSELPDREKSDESTTDQETNNNNSDDEGVLGVPEYIDADAYYEENGIVKGKEDINLSNDVQTEKEAIADLSSRGFASDQITYDYSMSGEYLKDTVATDSPEKHPVYTIYYYTPNGEGWSVMSINGQVTAYPFSYNAQSTREAALIISESQAIISYDSKTNQFYETIPNESELIVKVVDKIDTDTLDKLTFEEIDGL